MEHGDLDDDDVDPFEEIVDQVPEFQGPLEVVALQPPPVVLHGDAALDPMQVVQADLAFEDFQAQGGQPHNMNLEQLANQLGNVPPGPMLQGLVNGLFLDHDFDGLGIQDIFGILLHENPAVNQALEEDMVLDEDGGLDFEAAAGGHVRALGRYNYNPHGNEYFYPGGIVGANVPAGLAHSVELWSTWCRSIPHMRRGPDNVFVFFECDQGQIDPQLHNYLLVRCITCGETYGNPVVHVDHNHNVHRRAHVPNCDYCHNIASCRGIHFTSVDYSMSLELQQRFGNAIKLHRVKFLF